MKTNLHIASQLQFAPKREPAAFVPCCSRDGRDNRID
jgi:hypothetical protein